MSDSDGSDPTPGQIAKAIGWGKDADDADWISTVLREVDIPVMDHFDCNAAYGAVPDNTICTDGSGGKGVCGVSQEIRKWRNCRLTSKNPEYQLDRAILAEFRQLNRYP